MVLEWICHALDKVVAIELNCGTVEKGTLVKIGSGFDLVLQREDGTRVEVPNKSVNTIVLPKEFAVLHDLSVKASGEK